MTDEQKQLVLAHCHQAKLSPPDFRVDGTIRISSPSPIPHSMLSTFSHYDFEFIEIGEWPLFIDRVDDMKFEHYAVMRQRFD